MKVETGSERQWKPSPAVRRTAHISLLCVSSFVLFAHFVVQKFLRPSSATPPTEAHATKGSLIIEMQASHPRGCGIPLWRGRLDRVFVRSFFITFHPSQLPPSPLAKYTNTYLAPRKPSAAVLRTALVSHLCVSSFAYFAHFVVQISLSGDGGLLGEPGVLSGQ